MTTLQLMELIDNGEIVIVQMNDGTKRVIERYYTVNEYFDSKEITFLFINSNDDAIEFTHQKDKESYYLTPAELKNFKVLQYNLTGPFKYLEVINAKIGGVTNRMDITGLSQETITLIECGLESQINHRICHSVINEYPTQQPLL